MTNKEFNEQLEQIYMEHDNIFDIYCALKHIENDYKTTEFYKTYKLSIIDAYEIYNKHEGTINKLLKIIDNVDDNNKLELLFDKILTKFDLNNVLNGLSGDNRKLFEEILPNVLK